MTGITITHASVDGDEGYGMVADREIVIDGVMLAHGAGAVIDRVLVEQYDLELVDGVVQQKAPVVVPVDADEYVDGVDPVAIDADAVKVKPAGKDKQRKAGKDKAVEADPED